MATERRTTYERQRSLCHYCGGFTLFEKWTIDHKTPQSRGGTWHRSNKVGCCRTCNHAKGNMTVEEFLETDYLDRINRIRLGFTGPPTVKYGEAKRRHNERIGAMAEIFQPFRPTGFPPSEVVKLK